MGLFKKKECPEAKDIKTLARIGVIAAWHKDENGTHYTARQRPTAIISCFGFTQYRNFWVNRDGIFAEDCWVSLKELLTGVLVENEDDPDLQEILKRNHLKTVSTTERINNTAETTLFEIRPDYEIES